MKRTQQAILGTLVSKAGTFFFGNATTRMKNFMKDHGDEPITSLQLGRTPIEKSIASAMNVVSLGEFDESQKRKGYDAYFHLYYIINGKHTLEKNQNVNYKEYKPQDGEEIYDISVPKDLTINQFIQNGVDKLGEGEFWQNYHPLKRNCQWWLENTLKANGLNSAGATKFAFQDTEDLQESIAPVVQAGLEETTSLASGLDKFMSWISGGKYGLKRGGMVQFGGIRKRRIGQ